MSATATKKKPVKKAAKKKDPLNKSKRGMSKTEKAKLCRFCGRPRHKNEDGKLSPLCTMHKEQQRIYMSGYMANLRKGRKKGTRSPLPKDKQQVHTVGGKKSAKKKPVKKSAKPVAKKVVKTEAA